MRRLFLVFMMCLLPLQWSWATAASVCEHEAGKAHFGHHEHEHRAAEMGPSHHADDGHAHELPGKHPDCQVCHGVGAAITQDPEPAALAWTDRGGWPAYDRTLPEPPVESLLRPPLNLVA